MRKSLLALAAIAALAAPLASHASEADDQMFKIGLSLGYSMPYGDALKGQQLSAIYSGEIPIDLEVSYKFTPAISAGLYGGYGYGIVSPSGRLAPDIASSGVIGSITTLRFGIQGEYEFGKWGLGSPFIGARVGYVSESIEGKNGFGNSSATGWEYLTVILGTDFAVAKGFAVGPFVSGAMGQYTTEKAPGASSQTIPSGDQTLHGWLTIGLRGTLGL